MEHDIKQRRSDPHARAARAPVAPLLWRASAGGFALVLLALTRFVGPWRPQRPIETVFAVVAWLDQAVLISLPLFVMAAATSFVERRLRGGRAFGRAMCIAYAAVATLIAAVVLADLRIHGLYGFHINGFVVNLVTTRGGLASLEASTRTWVTVGAAVATAFVVMAVVLVSAANKAPLAPSVPRKRLRWFGAAIVVLLLDKGLYGYADLSGNGAVLRASGLFPFYEGVTFRSAARRLGVEPTPALIPSIVQQGRLAYPAQPIEITALTGPPPNILWLTAESLRWDLLTPQTMPHLWQFAQKNLRFTNHFSGGNRTRIGMFTQFYSLHGPYWSHVLEERRRPVLFDVLERLDYDVDVYTSAKFSYPEFDRTIFGGVPAERRHEAAPDEVFWHRDVRNVDAIIASLERRDTQRAFMRFLFLESTHAPYQFPDADAIATPYGSVANYALMDPQRDLAPMWNRYVNAAHFVDSQIGRLIDWLEQSGLLDHTIVVVTGDHGEEFLERGRWGHGSAFVDEQLRVPLVLRIPGEAPRIIDAPTSHLDIVPSLLPALGVTNVPSDYALGADVVRASPSRDHIVASEWSGFAYLDAEYAATIPLSGGFNADVRRRSDGAPVSPMAFLDARADALADVMRDMSRFLTKRERGAR
jgi:hypothetical protein